MCPFRIFSGVLVAALIAGGGFVVCVQMDLPLEWLPITFVLLAAILGGLLPELARRRAVRTCVARGCTGLRWRRAFPAASKVCIREFLDLIVQAFGLPAATRCRLLPGDKLLDVYRWVNPPDSLADGMEMETFASQFRLRYGIDLAWRDDITLGDVFGSTVTSSR